MSVSRMVRMSVEYECKFGFSTLIEEIATSLEQSMDKPIRQVWHSENIVWIDVAGTRIGAAYEEETDSPEGLQCLTLSLGKNGASDAPCILRDNREDFLASVVRLLADQGQVEVLATYDFDTPFNVETFEKMRAMNNEQKNPATDADLPLRMPGTPVYPRRVKTSALAPRSRCIPLGTIELPNHEGNRRARLYSNGDRLIQVPDTSDDREKAICDWAFRSDTPEETGSKLRGFTKVAVASAVIGTITQAAAAATIPGFGG